MYVDCNCHPTKLTNHSLRWNVAYATRVWDDSKFSQFMYVYVLYEPQIMSHTDIVLVLWWSVEIVIKCPEKKLTHTLFVLFLSWWM